MIRTCTFAIASLALATSAPASAQEVEYDQIEKKNLESGKDILSDDKAYIYITGSNRNFGVFLKTPDADDIAEYEEEWREKFEKAKKAYPGRLRRFEKKMEVWKRSRAGRKPEAPVEPTEETFSIGDIERRMIVTFGPQFVFDKDKDEDGEKTFSYLVEVEPGTYSYYGPIFYAPGVAPAGVCYCMGSVKFDAEAGKVTSLGNFLSFEWVTTDLAKQSDVNANIERDTAERVDYSTPAILSDFGSEPAELRAAGKMNNLFGILIGRLPPVEGVLAYDRDVPIDLKGQLESSVEVEQGVLGPTPPDDENESEPEIVPEPQDVG